MSTNSREVQVKSFDSDARRGLLTSRAQLVRMRVDLANQMRGILKPFGLIVGKGSGQPFETRVRERAAAVPSLQPVLEALLAAWCCIRDQIATLDRLIVVMVREDAVVRRTAASNPDRNEATAILRAPVRVSERGDRAVDILKADVSNAIMRRPVADRGANTETGQHFLAAPLSSESLIPKPA